MKSIGWIVLMSLVLGESDRRVQAQDASPPAPVAPAPPVVPAPPGAPAPPAPPKTTPAERALIAKLKTRATEWFTARKGLVLRCPTCDGSGSTSYLAGGRAVRRPCGSCGGDGKKLSTVQGRKVFYDLRTPQWRLRETAQQEADAEYRAQAAKLRVASWRIDRAELVGEKHGIVYTYEGKDSVARPTRWVLASEGTKPLQWFVWMAVSDEPWPGDVADAPGAQGPAPMGSDAGDGVLPVGEPTLEDLPELQGILLDGLLERTATTYRTKERKKAGRTLVLRLEMRDVPVERVMRQTVRTDSITFVRAIFPAMPADWDAIHLVYTTLWQDRFGERKRMPFANVSLTAETFGRMRWGNLTEDAAWELFSTKEEAFDGWSILVR